jgi:hypothetical protein
MVGHRVASEPADQQGLESLLACSQIIVFPYYSSRAVGSPELTVAAGQRRMMPGV